MRDLSSWLTHIGLIVTVCLVSADADAQSVGTTGTGDPSRVLWSDPSPLASRDLYWGPGSHERAPKGPFTLVEEKDNGTQPKIVVTGADGVTWDVKFGPEVHAEIAASRLVHALGYFTEEHYYVPTGRVNGASDLGRAAGFLAENGAFLEARFTRRDPSRVETDEEWTFKQNPFVGTKELSGLLILMTMLNNWDIRGAANNDVVRVTGADGPQEIRYRVGDLGGTFGRMGGRLGGPSKWVLADYRDEGFIEKVEDGVVHLDYDGFDSGMDRVPLEHARWFASLVSQLTPEQVRRAFEASGATPEEIEGFSTKFMEKIAALRQAVGGTPAR